MPDKVTITKKFDFSASHRYWREDWTDEKNERYFGLCISPYGHGHNYELHVTVAGKIHPDTGMIINLTHLKKVVNEIIIQFDHKFLNVDTDFFKDKIPTTENMALTLFDLIKRKLMDLSDLHLKGIRLYEHEDLYADVWGDN